MLKICVGSFRYTLRLHHGYVKGPDGPALALCDSDREEILISDVAKPARRLSHFWHEVAHAWLRELDIHQAAALGDEPIARLVALAMVTVDPITHARVEIYLREGIVCDSITMVTGVPDPIPVITFSDCIAAPSAGIPIDFGTGIA